MLIQTQCVFTNTTNWSWSQFCRLYSMFYTLIHFNLSWIKFFWFFHVSNFQEFFHLHSSSLFQPWSYIFIKNINVSVPPSMIDPRNNISSKATSLIQRTETKPIFYVDLENNTRVKLFFYCKSRLKIARSKWILCIWSKMFPTSKWKHQACWKVGHFDIQMWRQKQQCLVHD